MTRFIGLLLKPGEEASPEVGYPIREIDYQGWLIVEGATVRDQTLLQCYQHNVRYLRTLLSAEA